MSRSDSSCARCFAAVRWDRRGLAPDDALRRIRDEFGVHDGTIRDESGD